MYGSPPVPKKDFSKSPVYGLLSVQNASEIFWFLSAWGHHKCKLVNTNTALQK
jgi:hypothetical protein